MSSHAIYMKVRILDPPPCGAVSPPRYFTTIDFGNLTRETDIRVIVEVWEEVGDDGLDELEEPEIIIPEYVPTPITERPKPPMGFAVDSVQVKLVAPRVGGATESELED